MTALGVIAEEDCWQVAERPACSLELVLVVLEYQAWLERVVAVRQVETLALNLDC